MLTEISWDELPFPGTFQNGHHEEMPNVKIGNLQISAHNFSRSTIFMSIYMFLSVLNTMKYVLNSLLDIKRVKIQDGRQFYLEFILCRGRIFLYFIDN